MKYSNELIIDLPREKVIEIFDNDENAFKWMEGLKSWDMISGTKGEVGAKSKMVFDYKGKDFVIEEEITKKDLPDIINFVFTSKTSTNWNDNHFESTDDNKTRWVQSNVFKFKGMMRLMAFMMPGAFRKQSLKYMNDFKAFAEDGAETNSK